jgi:hypothetical protein
MLISVHAGEARTSAVNSVPHDVQSMVKFGWRRHHGNAIIAEVRADGRGAWSAAVWLRINPTVAICTPKQLESRESACAKADALTRRTFDHTCETATCGNWFPVDLASLNAGAAAPPDAHR